MRLHIRVEFVYKREEPSLPNLPPEQRALPVCLYNPPFPTPTNAAGVDHERSLLHDHIPDPPILGPSEFLNKWGGNAWSAVVPPLVVLSVASLDGMPADLSIDWARLRRTSPLGRPKNSRATRSTRKPLTNQLPTCYIHTQTHTPAVPQNGRYIPCSILVYCFEVEYTNHTMFHMYCKPILYSRYIVIEHSSLLRQSPTIFILFLNAVVGALRA